MTKSSEYAAMMKAAIIEENRRKVQRQKEEKIFVKSLHSHYQLSHLTNIRDELSNRLHDADGKFSSRPPTPSPPREEPTRCVGTFEACVRALEVTQGGASLWTAEMDGSLGIRNGVSGEFAYRLAPLVWNDQPILVDALHANGNNMFVGCSDGSLRVYDILVFVLAFEAKEHSASICGFATTFDQRTFSIDVDGALCKWDSEANNFNLISKANQDSSLRCIATYGYHVFTGTASGPIVAFDTDTLDVVRTFIGHTLNVTCLAIQDGYLFSGSNDTAVIVWNIGTGEALKTLTGHESGVSSFFCDIVAHRLWSADLHGVLNVWSTIDDEGFQLVQRCSPDEDSEVFCVKGVTVLDAAKIWTLGSNGVNKVWHTSKNRVEESIRASITTMQGIIEQDEVELAKWDELTRTLQGLAASMNLRIGDAMESHNTELLALRYFLDWIYFTKKRRIASKQLQLSALMNDRLTEECRRTTLRKIQAYTALKTQAKRSEAVAIFLRSQDDQRLLSIYGRKLHESFAAQCRKERATRISAALTRTVQRTILERVFQKLIDFRLFRQSQRKKQEFAGALEAISARRILVVFFCDWRLSSTKGHKRRLVAASVRSIAENGYGDAVRRLWFRWIAAVRERQQRNIRFVALNNIADNADRLASLAAFRKWLMLALERKRASVKQLSLSNASRIVSLEGTMQSMGHLIQRRSLLDEADKLIQRALLQRDAKRVSASTLQAEIDFLSSELERKKNRAPAVQEKTLQEQVADLLSLLKCRLLNFFTDFAQMQRVAEKTRRVGAQKVFLEAHQAVKRVVVEMTKEGYLPTDKPWPLSDKMIAGMKSHHTEVVLTAIKTMIMAYDALDIEQRSSLTSDEEVVVNAQNLHLLADRCLAARARRMRR